MEEVALKYLELSYGLQFKVIFFICQHIFSSICQKTGLTSFFIVQNYTYSIMVNQVWYVYAFSFMKKIICRLNVVTAI